MCNVLLNNGTVVPAYFVFYQTPPQLYIYPVNMTIEEIYKTFDDSEATKTITVEDVDGGVPTKTFYGFTELFAVQRSPYHPDKREYLVWLQRPDQAPYSVQDKY